MHSLAVGALLAQTSRGSGPASFIPLLLIVVVFYVLLIRPQQRKAKQHQQLVQAVGVGDRVVTIGGLHGTVESVDEDTMRLEVAPGTVITLTRGAIARRLIDADTDTDADTGLDEEAGAVAADPDPADTPQRD